MMVIILNLECELLISVSLLYFLIDTESTGSTRLTGSTCNPSTRYPDRVDNRFKFNNTANEIEENQPDKYHEIDI